MTRAHPSRRSIRAEGGQIRGASESPREREALRGPRQHLRARRAPALAGDNDQAIASLRRASSAQSLSASALSSASVSGR